MPTELKCSSGGSPGVVGQLLDDVAPEDFGELMTHSREDRQPRVVDESMQLDFDAAVTTLRAASGAVVTIINSRHSAVGFDQRIEAFGGTGVLQVANAPSSLVSLSTADAVEAKPPYEQLFLGYAVAFRAELRQFIKLVRGQASTSPTFEDGRAALVLADAAQRAATERDVVAVDVDTVGH